MGSLNQSSAEEDACNYALKLTSSVVLPMTLNAAIQLGLLEEIVSAGPGAQLSADELSSRIGATNPLAPGLLDRVLRLLASYSIVTSSVAAAVDGREATRRYGAAPVCKYLTRNEDGVSLASISLMSKHKVTMESWYHVKDAILYGGVPFNRAHGGLNEFEYHATDPSFSKVFNEAMRSHSGIIMRNILKVYRGFDEVRVLVDVGGGTGGTLGMITAKHPHIKGINFDLPHVIAQAAPLPGVEHVCGDVFVAVPTGDVLLLKWILHDWSDEDCVRILKNCKKAIPDNGKVVVVESIVPEYLESSNSAHWVFHVDLTMLLESPCGKERTKKDFRALAEQSGFSDFAVVCNFSNAWSVLHDWSDEDCVRILKNCKKAIPENGKVVVVESIVPEVLESSDLAHCVSHLDLIMLLESPRGKERTKKDFRALAEQSGFSDFAVICNFSNAWVMEFTT